MRKDQFPKQKMNIFQLSAAFKSLNYAFSLYNLLLNELTVTGC